MDKNCLLMRLQLTVTAAIVTVVLVACSGSDSSREDEPAETTSSADSIPEELSADSIPEELSADSLVRSTSSEGGRIDPIVRAAPEEPDAPLNIETELANPTINYDERLERLERLERSLIGLQGMYSADHPDVLRATRELEALTQLEAPYESFLPGARAYNRLTRSIAPARRQGPLSRALPGEEIWVIVTPDREERMAAQAGDGDQPGTGSMMATVVSEDPKFATEPETVPLPLKHTAVHAIVTGYVGTVDVTQQFENPFDEKIEAVYLFPLPEKAAVSEFVMSIGERRIRGILRERQEAEEIYNQARAQGYQASLLTQHRPNIFEQKVANIEPGKQIDVKIRYFHTLPYRDGWYSFVFPMVVGPRYNPPGHVDPVLALPRDEYQSTTAGAAVHYLRPSERSAHDINITVELNAGVEIEELNSSHRVRETRASVDSATVELANDNTIPNRDFILNFRVTGDEIKSNLLTYVDSETNQGYFTLMMYPPSGFTDLPRQPMEMVFVLDCSGSMSGQPLAQSKDAVLEALDQLEPDDAFQIIQFSSDASQFGPEPVLATTENISRARQYVGNLKSGGSTQMIAGIRAALGFPHDPSRLRFVTFLTDGYIGNEIEIIGEIHDRIGPSRIFSFGVGKSVNRYLLERMASEGRGAVAYLEAQDSGKEIMDFFFQRISHPAMTDVEIDWGDMYVTDVYPPRLPDLFVGRSAIVTGKYLGELSDPMIHGNVGGGTQQLAVPHDLSSPEHSFIPNVWARLRIADLADRQAWGSDPYNELARAIKETAIEYGLMSQYTSFVAVDASRQTVGDHGTTVYQAVPVPEGVSYETTVSD